ncbi:heparinase II/III-family protein [Alsobacter sp. KACC 23698]|uniref:Heparinase II/III-family protein n=1 Tax=Alsobacter sp. KACC 23698 TaxID=3149229 RepID=A0AAU7JME2_9HYPH
MKFNRLGWYVQRLRAMGPAEVAHRVAEQAKRARWRGDRRGWAAFDVGDGPLESLAAFGDVLRRPWPAEVEAATRSAAARTRAGTLELLGVPVAAGAYAPGLWALDPVSGRPWSSPDAYCFDVPFRNGDGRGDVKFVFELNRLQMLHPVAALAIRDGDGDAARFCLDVVLSWMEANPPFRGINWLSGIELALRLVSLGLVVAAAAPHLAAAERRRLRSAVAAHGFWLARYPSLHSSANNHHVAESLGLLVAGLLAPDLPAAPAWRAQGRRGLLDAAKDQFHADGWGAEQTPTYTAFTLEMLALGGLVLRNERDPYPAETWALIGKAAAALRSVTDQNGQAPRIGDDDEGRVLACPPDREPRYPASVSAALSGLIGEPALAPEARDPHWRDLLFASPGPGRSLQGVAHYPDGGITVIHDRIAGRRAMVAFDHGPLGFLSIAAHGHADALALWLHLDGEPVLVDAGTYLYSGGGAIREALRATASHNVLTIDGASQSATAGPFNWRTKACTRLERLQRGDAWSISASHDGYAARFGYRHERTIARTAQGFAVLDRLIGDGPRRPVEIRFHLRPDLAVAIDRGVATVSGSGGPLAAIRCPGEAALSLVKGVDGTPPFCSPAFGVLRSGQEFVASSHTEALKAGLVTQVEILPAG